jgi:Tol biopolymer transport system component
VAGDADANTLNFPELSPDGRRVAVARTVQWNVDVWLMDLVRGGFSRFTSDEAIESNPVWSPDGSQIAFMSYRKGTENFNLYLKPSNGVGSGELLVKTAYPTSPLDWSPDGRFLLYWESDPKTAGDLWVLEMSGSERKPRVVVNTPFEERRGQYSPDSRWLAYETNESGRFEIVVQPFPELTGKWQVSTGGGTEPRWRADGKELYYIAPDGKMMAARVTTLTNNRRGDSRFEAGAPVSLFPTRIVGGANDAFKAQYAVSRDGRFF